MAKRKKIVYVGNGSPHPDRQKRISSIFEMTLREDYDFKLIDSHRLNIDEAEALVLGENPKPDLVIVDAYWRDKDAGTPGVHLMSRLGRSLPSAPVLWVSHMTAHRNRAAADGIPLYHTTSADYDRDGQYAFAHIPAKIKELIG